MPEPPYVAIGQALKEGRIVPFLGAGASSSGRPENGQWTRTSPFLPRGAELSRHLAKSANFFSDDERERGDLLKVSAYYEQQMGRDELRRELQTVLGREFTPCLLHSFLAGLDVPMLIVTTNYDMLLESAFRAAGKPFDLVIYPPDSDQTGTSLLWWPHGEAAPRSVVPDELSVDLTAQTVIYKMHGTVDDPQEGDWSNFVITEDDYTNFLSRMTSGTAVPKSFFRHFRGRSFLFLGYSLSDWNLRVVLRNLGREFEAQRGRGGVKHWAIQRDASQVEEWLWSLRGVNVYDVGLDAFVERLRTSGGD
jgi:hypothetical protein